MAKLNETDRWAVKSEIDPKQFCMIAGGAKSKNIYIVEPKPEPEIWVPVTLPSLWGKRVNLLRDGLAVFVHNY